MTKDILERLWRYVPAEADLVYEDSLDHINMIEGKEDGLIGFIQDGSLISSGDGKTWSEPQPVRRASSSGEEHRGLMHLQRLKSGAIGAFTVPEGKGKRWKGEVEGQYGNTLWFTTSQDEGVSWSDPVMLSEPFNNAVMHGATVTHTGRVVVSAYNLVGEHLREMWVNVEGSRATYGDDWVSVGPHGYDAFMTYCWAYFSDDEGQTWRTNDKKGVWAAGGELFVNRDHSAGGHWRANEPVVAEAAPGLLLMLQRTPLGRLYQSWSSDNGTSWSQSEPTSLASALAPAALVRLPDTGDLLVVWNQTSRDEIERGVQRHRLSTAISKDGGASWLRGRNIFSQYGEGDRRYVEPPPFGNYRAMEIAPKLPPDTARGTYPNITLWQDRVIVQFGFSFNVPAEGVDNPTEAGRLGGQVRVSLPTSWFYQDLRPFG